MFVYVFEKICPTKSHTQEGGGFNGKPADYGGRGTALTERMGYYVPPYKLARDAENGE